MIQKKTKTIIITGTHLTPALELIRQLKQDQQINWNIFYVGREFNSSISQQKSIESQIIPKLNVKFYSIKCGKFDRKYFPNTIKGIPDLITGFFQSKKLIKEIKPNIVVSFGGYVSVPVIFNAFLQKITSITHEQTPTNSLTTKINSHFVKKIALSFNNQKQISQLPKNKVVVTGNLLRYELFSKQKQPKFIFQNTKKPIIYITAGNQGSHILNLVIKNTLSKLTNFFIIHQTGKTDFKNFNKLTQKYQNYKALEYIASDDIGWIFQNTQIIISRSGANTSQEIVAFSKKSILIPLPKSQQNEQLINAFWVKEKLSQKTIIIKQEDFNPQSLENSITKLINIKDKENTQNKYLPNLKLIQLIHEII